MIKHKNITLAIVLVVTTAMAFVGCKKTEKPGNETPNPDTLVTDTIPEEPPADNIYQFKVLNGEGDSVSLADYRDKVLLIVNTATQCGYTPQYTDLQPPGSFDDIHDFCTSRYGITFPQFAKINVNGASASPLYVWLKSKKPGDIQWNFTKFLIDRKGEVKRRFEPGDAMSMVERAVMNAL